jgi:hypothetical protein
MASFADAVAALDSTLLARAGGLLLLVSADPPALSTHPPPRDRAARSVPERLPA